ncbi:O-antigen ligase family protein [Myxococcota bacterium]|nr:O-antigen ligase family protein [Myxococcota bacterium]
MLLTAAATALAVHPSFSSFFVPKYAALGLGAGALLVGAGVRAAARGTPPSRTSLDLPVLAWLGFLALSLAWAPNPHLGLRTLAFEGALGMLALVAARAFPELPDRTRLVAAVAGLGVVVAAVAGLQLLGWDPTSTVPLSALEEAERADLYRATSTAGHKNLAAGISAATLPLLVGLGVATRSPAGRALSAGGLAVAAAATLGLQSRGAWIALAAAAAAASAGWAAARAPRGSLARIARGAAALAAVLALAAGTSLAVVRLAPGSAVAQRLSAVADWSSEPSLSGRRAIWRTAAAMAADHPATGVGVGQFALLDLSYELRRLQAAADPAAAAVVAQYAHSDPLQALAETGATGLVLWLALWLSGLARLVPRRGAPREAAAVRYGAAVALAVVAFHSLGDFPLRSPANAALAWLLLAAGATRPPTTGPASPGKGRAALARIGGIGAVGLGLGLAGLSVLDAAVDRETRLGAAWLDRGDADRARPHLQRALSWNPRSGPALYHAGRMHHARGELGEAIDRYRASLLWNDHHVARRDLGLAEASAGRVDDAIRDLGAYVTIHPGSSPRPFLVLGAQHLRKGDPEAAIRAFVRCNCPDGAFYAAELLREAGRLDAAAWQYRMSGTDRALAALAELEAGRGSAEEARRAAREIDEADLRRRTLAAVAGGPARGDVEPTPPTPPAPR